MDTATPIDTVMDVLPTEVMAEHAEAASALMKALSSPHRLMVLCTLVNGERSVGELGQIVPLSQSALSQHLARLRNDGLVATRRESQTIYYRIDNPAVEKVMGTLYDIYCAAPAPGK